MDQFDDRRVEVQSTNGDAGLGQSLQLKWGSFECCRRAKRGSLLSPHAVPQRLDDIFD